MYIFVTAEADIRLPRTIGGRPDDWWTIGGNDQICHQHHSLVTNILCHISKQALVIGFPFIGRNIGQVPRKHVLSNYF